MQENPETQVNPWLDIWTQPRATMRYILDTNPRRIVLWLAIVAGMVSAFTYFPMSWINLPYQQRPPLFSVLVLVVVVGSFFGVVHLYLMGWLCHVTGAWFGGKGTFTQVKSSIGWSNYPFILASIANLLAYVTFNTLWLRTLFLLLNLIIIVWAFVILFKLIAEAHQFSAWRAVGAFLLGVVIISITILLLSLFITLISSLVLG